MSFWNTVFVISLMHLVFAVPAATVFANDEHREDMHRELEELERASVELGEMIDDAREDDNERRLESLRREREAVFERMEDIRRHIEAIERDEERAQERERALEREREEAERREREEREHAHEHEQLDSMRQRLELRAIEMEIQQLELKLQQGRLELQKRQQEAAIRMAEFVSNEPAMTVMAVQQIVASAERPEHAAEVLQNLLERTDHLAKRRIIQWHLAQIWMATHRPERAREALHGLISSPSPRSNPWRPRDRDVGNTPQSAPREAVDLPPRVQRVFAAHDKNHDQRVSFDEWVRMKEGEMTPDRLEREQRLFGELAGDDGHIDPREFSLWADAGRPDPRPEPARDREPPTDRPSDRPEAWRR